MARSRGCGPFGSACVRVSLGEVSSPGIRKSKVASRFLARAQLLRSSEIVRASRIWIGRALHPGRARKASACRRRERAPEKSRPTGSFGSGSCRSKMRRSLPPLHVCVHVLMFVCECRHVLSIIAWLTPSIPPIQFVKKDVVGNCVSVLHAGGLILASSHVVEYPLQRSGLQPLLTGCVFSCICCAGSPPGFPGATDA